MNEYLKPCPFCGGLVYLEKKPLWRENGHGYKGCFEYIIKCNNQDCGCNVKLIGNNTIYHSDDEAINNAISSWNGRA